MSALYFGIDWTGRSQERPADGGAAGTGRYDQLHHFIADGLWDAAPLEAELLVQADRLVGGKDAVLVIDDTAMPKKGDRSVGVAPQYASSLGKTANCQTLVSLTLARGEVPVMVALRLFNRRRSGRHRSILNSGVCVLPCQRPLCARSPHSQTDGIAMMSAPGRLDKCTAATTFTPTSRLRSRSVSIRPGQASPTARPVTHPNGRPCCDVYVSTAYRPWVSAFMAGAFRQ